MSRKNPGETAQFALWNHDQLHRRRTPIALFIESVAT
jgi:hypothetical protein